MLRHGASGLFSHVLKKVISVVCSPSAEQVLDSLGVFQLGLCVIGGLPERPHTAIEVDILVGRPSRGQSYLFNNDKSGTKPSA